MCLSFELIEQCKWGIYNSNSLRCHPKAQRDALVYFVLWDKQLKSYIRFYFKHHTEHIYYLA